MLDEWLTLVSNLYPSTDLSVIQSVFVLGLYLPVIFVAAFIGWVSYWLALAIQDVESQ